MHEAIYEKLKEVARTSCLITYDELNRELKLGLDFEKREDRGKVGELLGEISKHEVEAGRPMLQAMVVRKERDGTYGDPGEGFYELARDLGVFHGDNKYIFWVSELNAVHNYWSSH
ncbi:MAG: hypothetical protein E3J40_02425 [Dehalococcoidia bacterium]|nr:MAG: hypothetical protein E3J40_02425 [Dehalococcoidia bacterium]